MKHAIEGTIERNSLDFLSLTIHGRAYEPGFLRPFFSEHVGKRVRITVEVLDDAAATVEPSR